MVDGGWWMLNGDWRLANGESWMVLVQIGAG